MTSPRKVTVRCEQCGSDYEVSAQNRNRARWCSPECERISRGVKPRNPTPGRCAGCGIEIDTRQGRKWCSDSCRKSTRYSTTCSRCGQRTGRRDGHKTPGPVLCKPCRRWPWAATLTDAQREECFAIMRSGDPEAWEPGSYARARSEWTVFMWPTTQTPRHLELRRHGLDGHVTVYVITDERAAA